MFSVFLSLPVHTQLYSSSCLSGPHGEVFPPTSPMVHAAVGPLGLIAVSSKNHRAPCAHACGADVSSSACITLAVSPAAQRCAPLAPRGVSPSPPPPRCFMPLLLYFVLFKFVLEPCGFCLGPDMEPVGSHLGPEMGKQTAIRLRQRAEL